MKFGKIGKISPVHVRGCKRITGPVQAYFKTTSGPVSQLVRNKQWLRKHLLQKSTRPRTPGGQKLQPVPYPIHWSHIAIKTFQNGGVDVSNITFHFHLRDGSIFMGIRDREICNRTAGYFCPSVIRFDRLL